MEHSFVVANPKRCIGCQACEIACAAAHIDGGITAAAACQAAFQPRLRLIRAPQVTMPVQCRQCEDAPCAHACPTQAIHTVAGRVEVVAERCIGCKSCLWACPFGAMDLVETAERSAGVPLPDQSVKAAQVAQKCDLCVGRSGGPACVAICPGDALLLVEPARLRQAQEQKRLTSAREAARMQTGSGR